MMSAIGLVPHTGWTWLVLVVGTRAAPRVERRERVVACDVLEGELYHLAAEHAGDRERFVATRRAAAVKQARATLRAELAGVPRRSYSASRRRWDRSIASSPRTR